MPYKQQSVLKLPTELYFEPNFKKHRNTISWH